VSELFLQQWRALTQLDRVFLAVVVPLWLLAGYLGWEMYQDTEAVATLEISIDDLNVRIAGLQQSSGVVELEKRRDEMKAQVESQEAKLPRQAPGAEVFRRIGLAATQAGVSVTLVQDLGVVETPGAAATPVAGVRGAPAPPQGDEPALPYRIFGFQVDASGTPQQAVAFLEALSSDPSSPLALDEIDLRRGSPLWALRLQVKVLTLVEEGTG
jgi:hypothetical protein